MSTERTTPYGMWRYGNDFRRASLYVRDGVDDKYFMPYYFLVGQSIELSFKALLMGRGESIEELRLRNFKYGITCGHQPDYLRASSGPASSTMKNLGVVIVDEKNLPEGAHELL